MSNTIKIKQGSSIPTSSDLENGELGYCSGNNKLYIGTSSGPTVPDNSNGKYLSLSGGTLTGDILFSNSNSTQATQPNLKWKTWGANSSTPYIGFATDQTDGTFVWSLKGTAYETGLAIGGGSENLLWKGTKIATISDIGKGTITIKQNGTNKGNFTLNQSNNVTIELTDTTTFPASAITSGYLSTANGGTGNNLSDAPAGAIIRKSGTSDDPNLWYTATANGAFYATGENKNATFGTLPIAQGGTSITSNPSMLVNLGSTSAASVFAATPRPGITGTLPVANGGTGQTSAYTSGSVTAKNSTTISSSLIRLFPYLKMGWVNMNITLGTSCGADSELQVAKLSVTPTYDTALAVNTPDSTYVYDISARVRSNAGEVVIGNSGGSAIPSGKAMRIAGFFVTG